MTRFIAREIAVHLAYEMSFTDRTPEQLLEERLTKGSFALLAPEDELYADAPGPTQREYIRGIVLGVAEHAPELDGYIEKYAKDWRFERISLIAGAVMRVCMYEVLYRPDIPAGAAVNAAVEIAKKYETAETIRFINGILGSFIRAELPEDRLPKEKAPG